jgi:hypothetical protein
LARVLVSAMMWMKGAPDAASSEADVVSVSGQGGGFVPKRKLDQAATCVIE